MPSVVADTHIIVWFLEDPAKLSSDASNAIANAVASPANRIYISAISLIEIQYLAEKQRIPSTFPSTLAAELDNPDPIFEVVPVDRRIANVLSAIDRAVVPDMPDRIITATASFVGLPLISADRAIKASGIKVVW